MQGEWEGEEEVLSVEPGTKRTEGAGTEGRGRGRLAVSYCFCWTYMLDEG